MGRKPKFTLDEMIFIRKNHKKMTITEMAAQFKCKREIVRTYCLKNDIVPKEGKKGRPLLAKTKRPRKADKARNDRQFHHVVIPGLSVQEEEVKRPPAVYTNSRSPYGIADELHRVNGCLQSYR